MGLVIVVLNLSHTNNPLLIVHPFSVQNQKMVVGLIDQVLVAFEKGFPNQLAHPKGMVIVFCTSHQDLVWLKRYPHLYPCP
jgi:hypothetical protein